MIILHYTGMSSAEEALKYLCSSASKVSAHYLLTEGGTIYALVDEDRRAWHAGVASWHGETDINSCSIGIELVNPGHDLGYQAFPESQMTALEELLQDIVFRYDVSAARIVGHSDVSPQRKRDPGELFNWQRLARKQLALWPEIGTASQQTAILPGISGGEIAALQQSLAYIGYQLAIDGRFGDKTGHVIQAFQRRFRPSHVSGILDGETISLIYAVAEMHGDA